VVVPPAQTCCGQPAFNSGFTDEARRVGRTLLDAFAGAQAVVAPSGSCTAMVRTHFPSMFAGTPDAERAARLASRTWELSEFLVDVSRVRSIAGTFSARVTVHDGCHGLRELGLRDQTRTLLAGIDGVELVEMPRADACCGFGGTFSVRVPEVATAMADDKLANVGASGADVVVSGDVGCLMHLGGRASRGGSPARFAHLAEILAEARGLQRPAPA
jgi:L-lactate dehydrogenase complex protein LldE